MNTQVIFQIDKKLKNRAMSKAQKEGITFTSILKLATKAFADGNLTVGLIGGDQLNTIASEEVKGALEDIATGKNVSRSFSSGKDAAKFLKA